MRISCFNVCVYQDFVDLFANGEIFVTMPRVRMVALASSRMMDTNVNVWLLSVVKTVIYTIKAF